MTRRLHIRTHLEHNRAHYEYNKTQAIGDFSAAGAPGRLPYPPAFPAAAAPGRGLPSASDRTAGGRARGYGPQRTPAFPGGGRRQRQAGRQSGALPGRPALCGIRGVGIHAAQDRRHGRRAARGTGPAGGPDRACLHLWIGCPGQGRSVQRYRRDDRWHRVIRCGGRGGAGAAGTPGAAHQSCDPAAKRIQDPAEDRGRFCRARVRRTQDHAVRGTR